MNIQLLKRGELEERVRENDRISLFDSALIYTPRQEVSTVLTGMDRFLKHSGFEDAKKEIRQLEQQTRIPANYLAVDVLGPSIYLQSTTHMPVDTNPDCSIGRFVAQLKDHNLKPEIEHDLHEDIRSAIINTKAFKHDLTYSMNSTTPNPALYNDGLLIADATAENYDNLTTFLDDYFTEVTSQAFHNNVQQAYTTLEQTRNDILEQFLET